MSVWALAFATRPLRGFCYAADRDQANLLRQAMETVIRLNPWLGQILRVKGWAVENIADGHPGKGGTLNIESSDTASSFGILPDLLICDEVCHWGKDTPWHSLLSSAAKRSTCLLVCISNAGFVDSWQWTVREAARQDPSWIFSRLDGPVATWLPQSRLDEQRRMLPEKASQRLWGHRWSSGGGDCLSAEDIDAMFDDTFHPMSGSDDGWIFVAGVDLGLTRDSSAVVTLAVRPAGNGRIRLADHRRWNPTPGRKLSIEEVEKYLLQLDARLGLTHVVLDPWQAEMLGQRLETATKHTRRKEGYHKGTASNRLRWNEPWVNTLPPSGTNLRDQASLLIESAQDRRFQLYPCRELRYDLEHLRVEEKSYGFRLTSPRDETGHGDSASAFTLALTSAHAIAGRKPKRGFRSLLDSCPSVSPSDTVPWQIRAEPLRDWIQEGDRKVAEGKGEEDGITVYSLDDAKGPLNQ